MSGYSILSLNDIISEKGEDFCRGILSTFSCPKNQDVENFLTKRSAIDFAKQGISQTFLVYASYQKKNVLCGYFTLASKYIIVPKSAVSKTTAKRLRKFSIANVPDGSILIAAPLIAQLGKNFQNGYDSLITGDELLKMALDKVRLAQMIVGGKVVYVECEDIPELINFYSTNGFVEFGKRNLDKDEKTEMSGTHLIQLLKYLN